MSTVVRSVSVFSVFIQVCHSLSSGEGGRKNRTWRTSSNGCKPLFVRTLKLIELHEFELLEITVTSLLDSW